MQLETVHFHQATDEHLFCHKIEGHVMFHSAGLRSYQWQAAQTQVIQAEIFQLDTHISSD